MFDGISCGRIALQRAEIEIDNYYASEIDKYAIQIAQKNFTNTIQLGNVLNLKEEQLKLLPKINLLLGGSPCFIAGTKIITDQGYKNIEEIKEGDYVLTHKNRYKKVLKIGNDIKFITELKAQGINTTYTTDNHPYYIREMKRVWDNKKRSYKRTFSEPKWKAVKDLNQNDYLALPILQNENNKYNLSKEDCWILGRYVADGHYRKDKRKNRINSYYYQVILSIGNHKLDYFKSKVKRNFSCYPHSQSVHRCVFNSMQLVNFIIEHNFGKGAINKKIPQLILDLPIDLAKEFLDGYLSGDGYCRNKITSATSISQELIMGLNLLIAKCYNVNSSIEYRISKPKTIIEGRLVNQHNTYSTRFQKEMKKQSNAICIDNFIWLPIKKINNTHKEAVVYNLEVEEDNSYTANNAIVHNCTGFSVAGKRLNFEDPQSKLFFEYDRILKWLMKNNNPNLYFLLENVKMKKEYEDIITDYMKVNPIEINSSLVSAQNRKRLYWTNIPNVQQPKDKNILLKDIVLNDVEPVALHNLYGGFKEKAVRVFENKSPTIRTAKGGGHIPSFVKKDLLHSQKAIDYMNRKTKDGRSHWDFKHYSDIKNDKSSAVVANFFKGVPYNVFKDWNCIRKFHPIECERLQTLPDNYTEGVSNTQRYKMIGNGWTVDVIAYILKNIK